MNACNYDVTLPTNTETLLSVKYLLIGGETIRYVTCSKKLLKDDSGRNTHKIFIGYKNRNHNTQKKGYINHDYTLN